MKIAVCIKQIEQVYARSGMDPSCHFLTLEDRISRVNPYDEAALEAALRIKDNTPEARIFLLTLGKITAEQELRRCLALGADEIYRIDTDADLDCRAKAKQLAAAARHLGADLVLCGKHSLDRQNGQVGAYMAQYLDCPFVSAVVDLAYEREEQQVLATRVCGRGVQEKIRCRLPAVLSADMGLFGHRLPRYDRLEKAGSAPLQAVISLSESIAPLLSTLKVTPPRPRTRKTPAPDSNLPAFQRIRHLLSGSKIEKKGRILEGDPEVLAEGIVAYLRERGFIDR